MWEKVFQARPKECQNQLESSMFISSDRNSIEFRLQAKSSSENNLLPFIRLIMKADKET